MPKTKKDQQDGGSTPKKQKPDDEETVIDFNIPITALQMAGAIRQANRQVLSRRYLTRKARDNATASMIVFHVLNSHLHDKPGCRLQFKKAFNEWLQITPKGEKMSIARMLINEYSTAFGTQMTAIKTRWFESGVTETEPEDGDSSSDKFVIMTRITYENTALNMICGDPSTFEQRPIQDATDKFKASYQVRKAKTRTFSTLILFFFISGSLIACANG